MRPLPTRKNETPDKKNETPKEKIRPLLNKITADFFFKQSYFNKVFILRIDCFDF